MMYDNFGTPANRRYLCIEQFLHPGLDPFWIMYMSVGDELIQNPSVKPRPWIKNLVPHLDPDVKRFLVAASESGMVKTKKKTIRQGDKTKVKKVVPEP